MAKKLVPILLAVVLLAAAIALLIPGVRGPLDAWTKGTGPGGSVSMTGFEAFIPYTPGYFPEGFKVQQVGAGSTTAPDVEVYEEFYASETHFIKLIQSQGEAAAAWAESGKFRDEGYALSRSLQVQGQPAEIDWEADLEGLVGGDIDLSAYDTADAVMVTFFLEGIKIQVVTNLPEEEAIAVAENLVPSVCLSKPEE